MNLNNKIQLGLDFEEEEYIPVKKIILGMPMNPQI